MDRRSDKYVRLCIIPINVSAGIVIDSTHCTMTPFVPNVSQNDTCYYAARDSHEEISSNFRSRNCGGGIGMRCQCFPFRQRGDETKREKVSAVQLHSTHRRSKLCLRREEAMICRLHSSRSAFIKSN